MRDDVHVCGNISYDVLIQMQHFCHHMQIHNFLSGVRVHSCIYMRVCVREYVCECMRVYVYVYSRVSVCVCAMRVSVRACE